MNFKTIGFLYSELKLQNHRYKGLSDCCLNVLLMHFTPDFLRFDATPFDQKGYDPKFAVSKANKL